MVMSTLGGKQPGRVVGGQVDTGWRCPCMYLARVAQVGGPEIGGAPGGESWCAGTAAVPP